MIILFSILDYITGWMKGLAKKRMSSETGFKGICKKVFMFVIIMIANNIQHLIGGEIPLREMVLMFYICNEALSILENAAEFVPVPQKIKEVLLQLRDSKKD